MVRETYGTIHRVTTDGVFTQYSVPLPGDGDPTQWIAAGPDGALWFTAACNPCATAWIGRLTTSGIFTEYAIGDGSWLLGGITGGPDGGIWFTSLRVNHGGTQYVARAPACGLGLSASHNGTALTANFDLGIDQPASWSVQLQNLPVLERSIPEVVPPRAFDLSWNMSSLPGNVLVKSALSSSTGQVMCAEWTTVTAEQ